MKKVYEVTIAFPVTEYAIQYVVAESEEEALEMGNDMELSECMFDPENRDYDGPKSVSVAVTDEHVGDYE